MHWDQLLATDDGVRLRTAAAACVPLSSVGALHYVLVVIEQLFGAQFAAHHPDSDEKDSEHVQHEDFETVRRGGWRDAARYG